MFEGQPVRRRYFITPAGGAAVAWPLAARAQRPNQIARIGYLDQESAAFDCSHGESTRERRIFDGWNNQRGEWQAHSCAEPANAGITHGSKGSSGVGYPTGHTDSAG